MGPSRHRAGRPDPPCRHGRRRRLPPYRRRPHPPSSVCTCWDRVWQDRRITRSAHCRTVVNQSVKGAKQDVMHGTLGQWQIKSKYDTSSYLRDIETEPNAQTAFRPCPSLHTLPANPFQSFTLLKPHPSSPVSAAAAGARSQIFAPDVVAVHGDQFVVRLWRLLALVKLVVLPPVHLLPDAPGRLRLRRLSVTAGGGEMGR